MNNYVYRRLMKYQILLSTFCFVLCIDCFPESLFFSLNCALELSHQSIAQVTYGSILARYFNIYRYVTACIYGGGEFSVNVTLVIGKLKTVPRQAHWIRFLSSKVLATPNVPIDTIINVMELVTTKLTPIK